MASAAIPRFSVSDFLAVVNQSLEVSFNSIEIQGEIASFKINQQKFVFFDLKDDSGTINCFMTVWQLRIAVEDGMNVIIRAIPKITPWGKFSLTVQAIQPVGEGSLLRSFALLKSKLDKEGLFDQDRKRALPTYPSRVAIISSTGAAGYADFMKIAEQRWGSVRFTVANVQVQGQKSPDQIVRAIEHFGQMIQPPEVIVIIRGGGSADDLQGFNDELLVRAVASSRVPILTGIGHETDESLVDLAADVRAVTPTNAAQILLPNKVDVLMNVTNKLDLAASETLRQISTAKEQLTMQANAALLSWSNQISEQLRKLQASQSLLDEYDPERVLRRGYARITGVIKVGNVVQITTENSLIKARIEEYEKRSNN